MGCVSNKNKKKVRKVKIRKLAMELVLEKVRRMKELKMLVIKSNFKNKFKAIRDNKRIMMQMPTKKIKTI